MIAIIAAYIKNRVIGKDGKIPWNIEGEQRRFKELTLGNTVIMGRRTYEEIGRPLPDRKNIVISGTKTFAGCINVRSFEEALAVAGNDNVYISGGSDIYRQSLSIVEKMYITEIEAEIEGDTFFPKFDESKFTKTIDMYIDGAVPYRYVTYTRIG